MQLIIIDLVRLHGVMFAATADRSPYLFTHPFLETKLGTVLVSELSSLHVCEQLLEQMQHVLTHQAERLESVIGRGESPPSHSQTQTVRRLSEMYEAGNEHSRLGREHVTSDRFGADVTIVVELETTDADVVIRAFAQVLLSVGKRADSFDRSPRTAPRQGRLLACVPKIAARRVRSLPGRSWIVVRG